MMKRLTMLLFTVLLVSPVIAADEGKPHLLSTLTSASNDTQAMALILSRHYVQGGGSAQVLLCDSAAELALRDATMGDRVVQPAGASPRQMLGALIEAGVKVEVCAIFLPNREADEDDLRDGIGVARPDRIAEVMARPETRLFTN